MKPSTDQLNHWVITKCEKCGGHGGGHFDGCATKITKEKLDSWFQPRFPSLTAEEVEDLKLEHAREDAEQADRAEMEDYYDEARDEALSDTH